KMGIALRDLRRDGLPVHGEMRGGGPPRHPHVKRGILRAVKDNLQLNPALPGITRALTDGHSGAVVECRYALDDYIEVNPDSFRRLVIGVPADRRKKSHRCGRTARHFKPGLPSETCIAGEWRGIAEGAAFERNSGQDRVVQRPLEQVHITPLACKL